LNAAGVQVLLGPSSSLLGLLSRLFGIQTGGTQVSHLPNRQGGKSCDREEGPGENPKGEPLPSAIHATQLFNEGVWLLFGHGFLRLTWKEQITRVRIPPCTAGYDKKVV
jgi:hypothetical protein